MSKRTPAQAAEAMQKQVANIEKAKRLTVKVGVIGAGARIYKGGKTVVDIATIHEYGTDDVPMRSFLRTPFFVEKGKDAEAAMDSIGVKAQKIIFGAFDSEGYGFWAPLKPQTIKKKKGKSDILVDVGTLRQSITWAVK